MRLKPSMLLLLQAHIWLREVYQGNNWGTGGFFFICGSSGTEKGIR